MTMPRMATVVAALLALTPVAKALGTTISASQVVWTTLDDPTAVAEGAGTYPQGVSGSYVVGYYGSDPIVDSSFIYNTATNAWTTINYPGGDPTIALGVDGNNVVGYYYPYSSSGPIPAKGFVYNIASQSWATLVDPSAGTGPTGLTELTGISGNTIVATYYPGEEPSIYNIATQTWTNPRAFYGNFEGIQGNNAVGFDGNDGFVYSVSAGNVLATLSDPSAGSNGTVATGIGGNDVVGYFFDSSGNKHGFFYDGSTYTTLDDPAAPAPNGTEINAISGNTMVGIYFTPGSSAQQGFLAEIVPEPPSLVLATFGALAIGALTIRRRSIRI